jgi:hypothetical protein
MSMAGESVAAGRACPKLEAAQVRQASSGLPLVAPCKSWQLEDTLTHVWLHHIFVRHPRSGVRHISCLCTTSDLALDPALPLRLAHALCGSMWECLWDGCPHLPLFLELCSPSCCPSHYKLVLCSRSMSTPFHFHAWSTGEH